MREWMRIGLLVAGWLAVGGMAFAMAWIVVTIAEVMGEVAR